MARQARDAMVKIDHFRKLYDVVIPGRAEREPGIHNHDWRLWIPGLRQEAHPGMTAVVVLAIPRRNIPDTGRMRGEIVETIRQVHALGRWRVFSDRHAGPPFLGGPDRPRHETAAAVRAHIVELVLDAVRAERAFIRADARLQ